jgi:hypothetical protein
VAVGICERPTLAPAGPIFAKPKSRILALPSLVTKRFAGLMSRWTMPWACAAPERIGSLNRQFQHFFERKRFARNAVPQCFAVEKLHRNELLAVLLANVVDSANAWVIQRRSGLCFSAEAFESSGVVGCLARQEFQTDWAM